MAKKRRRSTPRSTKRPERVSHNARIWLATLSTVVGVATGMFTLRDQVFPGESGTAGAVSESAFRADVGEICDELNDAEEARVRDDRKLRKALSKARSVEDQRDALLDGARRAAARSTHMLAKLSALTTPSDATTTQRSTVAAWTRNVERVRSYIERLDRAGGRDGVTAAVEHLSRIRTPLGRDGLRVNTGLERLGASQCDIDPPIVSRTITLPEEPTPVPKRQAAPSAQTTTPAAAAPPATATPTASPQRGTINPGVNNPQPSSPRPSTPVPSRPRVNVPEPAPPISGGGDDG